MHRLHMLPLHNRWWHNFEAVHPETQERRSFFIQYLVMNPGGNGRNEPVFGQLNTTTRSGNKPSYARLGAGTWGDGKVQLFNYYPLKEFKASSLTMRVNIGGTNTANETALKGSVSVTPEEAQAHPEWLSDAGSISWDLKVEKVLTFSTGIAGAPLFIKVGMQLVLCQLLTACGVHVCWCRLGQLPGSSSSCCGDAQQYAANTQRLLSSAVLAHNRASSKPYAPLAVTRVI
jgi:hypothetical protein